MSRPLLHLIQPRQHFCCVALAFDEQEVKGSVGPGVVVQFRFASCFDGFYFSPGSKCSGKCSVLRFVYREADMSMQWDLPLICALDSTKGVSQEVIEGFGSTWEALKWAYENRTNPGGKPVSWLAKNMGMQRQRLSRMLNIGDFKMDPGLCHLWDCLVGNTALTQYVELQGERVKQARAQVIEQAIRERLAA